MIVLEKYWEKLNKGQIIFKIFLFPYKKSKIRFKKILMKFKINLKNLKNNKIISIQCKRIQFKPKKNKVNNQKKYNNKWIINLKKFKT